MKIYTNGVLSLICDFGRIWVKTCLLISAFDLESTTVKALNRQFSVAIRLISAAALIEPLGKE